MNPGLLKDWSNNATTFALLDTVVLKANQLLVLVEILLGRRNVTCTLFVSR
jgi:hypothetical protein